MDQSYTACGEGVCIIWYGRRLNFRVQVQPLEPLTHFARDVMPGSFLNQSDLGSRRRFTGQGFLGRKTQDAPLKEEADGNGG